MINGKSPESPLWTPVRTAFMEFTFDKNDKREAVTRLLGEISGLAGGCHANFNVCSREFTLLSATYRQIAPWLYRGGDLKALVLNLRLNGLPMPVVGSPWLVFLGLTQV